MKRTAGISLMLLIFLSLCLITFSVLSLSGANADEKLSQKSADRTTEYYAAVTEANEILSEIDAWLADAFLEAQDSEEPKQAYFEACAAIDIPDVDLEWTVNGSNTDDIEESVENSDTDNTNEPAENDNTDSTNDSVKDSNMESTDETIENEDTESTVEISYILSYNVEMSDDQHLHVELSITWPSSDSDTLYHMVSQQVVSTQDWSADTSQNLYQGNTD
ncbi:MAG: hypothetical protein LIP12_06460 [Clostridiales bacterium]|nr:hypothetical protein [Clostridiales bacterium]